MAFPFLTDRQTISVILHGVADLFQTILFVPDPLRRLLRNSGRKCQNLFAFKHGQRAQLIRRAMTTQCV
jgi:hypothetical protein